MITFLEKEFPVNILFLPSNIQISVEEGTTLLAAIYEAGLMVDASCGGHGKCGKCKVLVTKGNDRKFEKEEVLILSEKEREQGIRLACFMRVKEDTCVLLPDLYKEKEESICVEDVATEESQPRKLGLALDVGTTTMEYVVLDLENGSPIIKDKFYNSLRKYGADVIARISACQGDDSKVKILQQELIEGLKHHLSTTLACLNLSMQCIIRTVVVGNTAMCHFFTGLSPYKLAKAPFQTDYLGGDIKLARELGLPFGDKATLEILPMIGGHIGADTVGCLAELQMNKMEGYHLLVDIGTNGELVLKGEDILVACSTAAGPAFEGGSMAYGMCAGLGAINKVFYQNKIIKLQVGGNVKPVGLSGTGILDGIAALYKAGIVDNTGYLKEEYCSKDPVTGQMGYALYGDEDSGIYITRQDIRQFQLAKAAISAGIKILLMEADLSVQQLSGIWIAGAFGTHLNLENAMLLGLLPFFQLTRYHQIGNAALSGAIKRIKDQVSTEELRELTKGIQRVELADLKQFKQIFLEEMGFKGEISSLL